VMHAKLVPVDPQHIHEVCEAMRARERYGFARIERDPEEMIGDEVRLSFMAWAGVVRGEVIALGGVRCRDIFSEEAYVWMVCSERVERFPLSFIRGTLEAFTLAKACFKTVYGYVVADFHTSIRWLEWMGFTVEPAVGETRLFWWGERPKEV
jgi:hypothetical protein